MHFCLLSLQPETFILMSSFHAVSKNCCFAHIKHTAEAINFLCFQIVILHIISSHVTLRNKNYYGWKSKSPSPGKSGGSTAVSNFS